MKLIHCAVMAILCVSLWSCSKGNDKGVVLDTAGKHPSGWAATGDGGMHPGKYIALPSSCYECHGKNLAGGISRVSCFSATRSGISCHPNGPSGHPAGWALPDAHGAATKAASNGQNGLERCRVCHGSDLSGGSINVSCLNNAGCHGAGVMAPHSPKPWRSKIGGRTHTVTDASNAAACAVCHSGGANSSRVPSAAPQPGAAPGCFNNTLCHGVEGHAAGWKAPAAHGAAAKSPSGGENGFSACTQCHGTKYDGGSAEQSCLNTAGCHGAGILAPHPAKPWRSTSGGVSHVATDTSNAGQCAVCHTGGANSTRKPRAGDKIGLSGCFDNTLCHGVTGHAAGWSARTEHGAEAKKAPTASTGFSFCQACHGVNFNNGTAVSCMNSAGCHGSGVNAPHAKKPWFSRTGGSTHTTTDPANVGTCSICHTAGNNSTIKPPVPSSGTAGCFNNTLCHFHQIPYAPSNTIPATLHGGEAKKDLTVCQACHGSKGTTAFDGVTLADGTKTIACSNCHTFAKAHPTDWQGSGTSSHRNAGSVAVACAVCHDVTQGRTAPLAGAPSCFSFQFANGAGQTRFCHPSGPGVVPHAVPYNNHNATARGNFSYCLGCHQIPANSTKPPGCQNCHLLNPQTYPNNCVSCHSNPPNGASYPNIAGSHASHNALNVAANTQCDQCHLGLGLGTVDHLNRARLKTSAAQVNQIVFGSLAKSQSTNATSCATTWCHGGNAILIPQNNPARTAPVWGTPFPATSVAGTGGPSGTSGTGYCAQCHGYPPLTTAHTGVTVSQCNVCHSHINTDGVTFSNPARHIDGQIQASGGHVFPYPGASHAVAGATIANCSGCHNTTTAGVFPVPRGTAPNCRACHISSLGIGCSDCHGSPPNGVASPNRNIKHAAHTLPSVTCSACHNGAGSGTAQHGYGTTTVSILASYQAKSGGAPLYSGGQCLNISCHGGQITPLWTTGSINVNTDCTKCHSSGVTQYNSYNSGMHSKHINDEKLACTACHNITSLANSHFIRLDTQVMEGPAAATIGGGTTQVTSYNSVTGSCTPTSTGPCHSAKNW